MAPDQGSEGPTPRRPRRPPPPARTPSPSPRTPSPSPRAPAGTPARGARDPEPAPQYTRYRAARRALPGAADAADEPGRRPLLNAGRGAGGGGAGTTPPRGPSRWRRITPKRAALGLLALIAGWLLLALVLFLLSSHINRTAPPSNVARELEAAGPLPFATNNILILGSDKRQQDSKEPGADINGPSRSDTIMLIRTGGGHAARLSIPRDTVIEIPGHGQQKINAAYAFGGPALSISVIKHYLGVPINHLVEVNFENFPQLIDAMGGVNYTGGCVLANLDGGSADGGFTLRLPAGTHHIDGKEALALARTRENLCAPAETDLNREEHQQALLSDMQARLLSPSSLLRLPLIAWNAPPAIISDMSGPELIALFGALAVGGTPPTRVLEPSGNLILPDGEEGLTVSESEKHAAVAQFMAG
jgi:LCP family protein required for cell wall assembly